MESIQYMGSWHHKGIFHSHTWKLIKAKQYNQYIGFRQHKWIFPRSQSIEELRTRSIWDNIGSIFWLILQQNVMVTCFGQNLMFRSWLQLQCFLLRWGKDFWRWLAIFREDWRPSSGEKREPPSSPSFEFSPHSHHQYQSAPSPPQVEIVHQQWHKYIHRRHLQ